MNKLKKFKLNKAIVVLGGLLFIFNLFAIVKVIPENSALEINYGHEAGDYDRKVYRVFDLAQENASQAFLEDFDNFTYHGRNPGLFKFVAEAFIRLGATTPLPIQLFAIFIFNIGVVVTFLWVRKLFESNRIGLLAVFFLVTTPYLLVHSSSIHQEPYEFLFFGLTILSYLYYLENRKRRFLIGVFIVYFFLTQNYYMFYISTAIIVFGIHKLKTGKWFEKHLLAIFSIPIVSMSLVILQAVLQQGTIDGGIKDIVEILAARTVDARIPDSEWYPDKKFIDIHDYLNMPTIISSRVINMFYLSMESWFLLLGGGLLLNQLRKQDMGKKLFLFFILTIAGLSWNVIFFQHTYIHGFSAQFGFFLWMCTFAFLVNEIWLLLRSKFENTPPILRLFLLLLAIYPFVLTYLNGFIQTYITYLFIYLKNIL